jgi:hypothetical protein
MKTVKTSRQFRGSPISLRALCQLEDRSLPFSIMDIVATDGVRHFSGNLSTGDVDCTWEMVVWQNGFWSVKGDFHDDGALAGDFFFAEFLLDRDHAVGARIEGSILNIFDSRHLSVSKDGSDRWVRENWHKFEASGPTVRLHAAPAIGQLIAVPFIALAAVPFVVFFGIFVAGLASGGKKRAKRCDDSIDTFDSVGQGSTACVEYVPVEE